jgi:hypothetical protein
MAGRCIKGPSIQGWKPGLKLRKSLRDGAMPEDGAGLTMSKALFMIEVRGGAVW